MSNGRRQTYSPGALRAARGLWTLAALLVLAHGAATLLGVGEERGWVTSQWFPVVIFSLATATCAARAIACPRHSLIWLVLTAGVGTYTLGQVARVAGWADDTSLLSPATLLWLLIAPFALAALTLRVRAGGRPVRRDLWLDGVIGGLTIAGAGSMLIFELVVHSHEHGVHIPPAVLAFALADLAVVGYGVGLAALFGWRPPAAFVALIAGFAVLCVQDTLYLSAVIHQQLTPSLDTAWTAALLAITAGAAWTGPASQRARRTDTRMAIAAPLTFGTFAVLQAMVMGIMDHESRLCVILVGLSLLAVVARCALAFRAHQAAIEGFERAEAHLAQAQRQAQVGSWEWDDESGRLTWSAEMARLHGWTGRRAPEPDEAMELVHRDDRADVMTAFETAWTDGGALSVEYRVAASDRVLLCRGMPSERAGHLFGTCQDVTDRFARTEAERASRAKSEFLSRMSHELRTPLNAILGFGQLLGASRLDERQRGNVDHVLSAGRHLLDLVNEVLDIARIEAGELSLSLEPVEVGPVVGEAVELLRPAAAERRVTIAVELGAASWVQADQQRLKQIVLNLVSNAIKYNREGGHVDVRVEPIGVGHVRVSVADTGPGIAPEHLCRLFQPFERLGAERSGVEGTGLGLSLSHGLAEAMGAALTVDTEAGAGSTFALELRATQPAAVHIELPPAPALDGAVPSHFHQVVCIEDNVSNLTLIEEVFVARPGIRLLTALQGSIGLELVHQHRPDLVLLDLNLPDMGGADVLRRLRTDPATAGIPVVVVSADATPRQVDRLLDSGATAYVTKPIDVLELLAVVDGVLAAPAMV